ncbi:hypothetical protein ACVBEG_14000 [Pseudomonas sp. GG8]
MNSRLRQRHRACGVPFGVCTLTGLDSGSQSIGVYLLIGTLTIMGLVRLNIAMVNNRLGAWLVGSCSGALIRALSIGGPLVVAWPR